MSSRSLAAYSREVSCLSTVGKLDCTSNAGARRICGSLNSSSQAGEAGARSAGAVQQVQAQVLGTDVHPAQNKAQRCKTLDPECLSIKHAYTVHYTSSSPRSNPPRRNAITPQHPFPASPASQQQYRLVPSRTLPHNHERHARMTLKVDTRPRRSHAKHRNPRARRADRYFGSIMHARRHARQCRYQR